MGYDKTNMKLRLHAGRRNPLGSRTGVRTKRYAILMRADGDATQVLLKSDVIGKPDPLVGYDFYEKDPFDKEIPAKYLGKSDWRGAFNITKTDKAFRLIYVRSGGKLMARMPTIPGYEDSIVAFMRDDDSRLEAEAYMRSVESEIMDQVVQRRLLESDILRRLKDGKVDVAGTLLERFQGLAKHTDMKDRLDSRQGEIAYGGVDRRTTRLIGMMFDRTEKLVNEHIKPATLLTLQRKVQEAKGGK